MRVECQDDEKLGRSLRRLNAEIADGCILELACSSEGRGVSRHQCRTPADGLVLLGVLSSGAVAVVPVMSARTVRRQLLLLSDSVAECAMLLGLGTSLYGVSRGTGD